VILWVFKDLFQNEAADCKATWYRIASLIEFAWSKVAAVGDDVSAFERTRIYPFNSHKASKYFFSNSDTCETMTFMETAHPNMAMLRMPSSSVTDSQNVLPISAEPSLSTLRTVILSDTSPEEVRPPEF
jgi:hypothetical protein